jgi:hypothetical protein
MKKKVADLQIIFIKVLDGMISIGKGSLFQKLGYPKWRLALF